MLACPIQVDVLHFDALHLLNCLKVRVCHHESQPMRQHHQGFKVSDSRFKCVYGTLVYLMLTQVSVRLIRFYCFVIPLLEDIPYLYLVVLADTHCIHIPIVNCGG